MTGWRRPSSLLVEILFGSAFMNEYQEGLFGLVEMLDTRVL